MKSKILHFFIVTIFCSIGATFAQNTAVAAKDIKFQITLAGGKNIYRRTAFTIGYTD